jgi:glycosyltransferase involved in cell wall biosynthesis
VTRQTKGRVVVVTPNEPDPFGQANGRWCHALLKGLDQAGWRVRCLSVSNNARWESGARRAFADSSVEMTFYPLEQANGLSWRRKWRSIRQPFSYPLSDALRRDVETERGRGCDVLHLEQLWSGYLAEGAAHVLTSVHHLEQLDLGGEWHLSLRYLRSKLMMLQAERRLLGRLGQIRTTTDRLAAAVRDLNPRATVHVVPIALDPSVFRFEPEDCGHEPVIGFLASMTWNPGYVAAVRLVTRILPLVRKRRPDTQVLLAGWGAERLAQYAAPGVEIVANVPEAEPYYRRLQVLAYPLVKGSGMMAKVLEALAYGVPVVTTSEGSEGFAIDNGVHAFVEDDDEAFAEKVIQLLADRDLRRAMRRHGRDLVEQRYSPAPAVAQLEQAYATL